MGGRKPLFTPEQANIVADLTPKYADHVSLCRAIKDATGVEVTPRQTTSWIAKRGLRLSKAHIIEWTQERIEWFQDYVPGHSEDEIQAAWRDRFGFDIRVQQIANAKVRFNVKSGTVGGRFKKGQAAWNKGLPWEEWMPTESQERSLTTAFDGGIYPHNAIDKPIGYERTNRDGYVEVKIALRPGERPNDNFKHKHHIVWERVHGQPVPEGHVIAFADHDKTNFDPDNLVAIPRSVWVLIRKKGCIYHDRETLELAVARANVDHAAYQKQLGIEINCKSCGKPFKRGYIHQRRCRECIDRERREK